MNTSNKMPKMFDVQLLISAGINPINGLPIKYDNKRGQERKDLARNIKKTLRVIDEQNAVNRYVWYNLPKGLTGELIERILYYRGQGILFKIEDTYYFLPYCLNGTIDVYGRYNGVRPLPFFGTSESNENKKGKVHNLLEILELTPIYEVTTDQIENLESVCVILNDYSKQISQIVIPRAELNEPILDIMADCFPFARTNLLNSTGISGIRVNSPDEQWKVESMGDSVYEAAIAGKRWVTVVGSDLPFQELSDGLGNVKAEEYLMTLQALDNYRLSLYGLENGGLFQKKSHMLEAEQRMNQGNVSLVMQDGLKLRQNFCNIVNSIFEELLIWCEPNEEVINADLNLDGIIDDSSDETVMSEKITEETDG